MKSILLVSSEVSGLSSGKFSAALIICFSLILLEMKDGRSRLIRTMFSECVFIELHSNTNFVGLLWDFAEGFFLIFDVNIKSTM